MGGLFTQDPTNESEDTTAMSDDVRALLNKTETTIYSERTPPTMRRERISPGCFAESDRPETVEGWWRISSHSKAI